MGPDRQTSLLHKISELSATFAAQRAQRQQRRALDPADFAALRDAGFLLVGVPAAQGGTWEGAASSTRPVCEVLRALGRGDSSVALVCAMHPAVLSYWLATPEVPAAFQPAWDEQRRAIFDSVLGGAFWGTITSEPGSGGDVGQTRAVARPPRNGGDAYLLDGQKHFGSGSGITSFMVTTAVPAGESDPDWFYLDFRGVPWPLPLAGEGERQGERTMRLVAEWDGHGMAATQSHALAFSGFPAQRVAWPGHRQAISDAATPFIGCLFSAVVVGIVDAAMAAARAQLGPRRHALRAYEQVEWTRAELDAWLISQALEGMLRAVESGPKAPKGQPKGQIEGQPGQPEGHRHREVWLGKAAIAELAESCLQRICRVMGGGSFSRRSPFGHWFEDVRALGFLRPPWALAYDGLFASTPEN